MNNKRRGRIGREIQAISGRRRIRLRVHFNTLERVGVKVAGDQQVRDRAFGAAFGRLRPGSLWTAAKLNF